MGYTNRRYTIKWWDPYTDKLKYFSYENFDEHSNKFGKGWYPCSELMLGENTSTLPKLKIDLSYQPFIKDDTFEFNVNFPPRCTNIFIVTPYCEDHNM